MSSRVSKTKELWKNPEYRKHMSDVKKGKMPSNINQLIELAKLRKGKPNYWGHHTEETKEKMSKSHLGKSSWNEGLKGIKHKCRERIIDNQGYFRKRINHKYVLEHHYVWLRESEWHFIPKGFVVHHKNGNKQDNRIENLACIPLSVHLSLHNQGKIYWGKNQHLNKGESY